MFSCLRSDYLNSLDFMKEFKITFQIKEIVSKESLFSSMCFAELLFEGSSAALNWLMVGTKGRQMVEFFVNIDVNSLKRYTQKYKYKYKYKRKTNGEILCEY